MPFVFNSFISYRCSSGFLFRKEAFTTVHQRLLIRRRPWFEVQISLRAEEARGDEEADPTTYPPETLFVSTG